RATRHEMIVFVNQRPVDSRTLNYGLIESYHESLPKGRYPLAFVFFECDPAAVDVNVHPAKREVRFRSEPLVRSFVIRSVLQRLREIADVGLRSGDVPAPAIARAQGATQPTAIYRSDLPAMAVAPPPTFVPSPIFRGANAAPAFPQSPFRTPPSTVSPIEIRESKIENRAQPWRFVGLAHGTYALFETAAGLVLLDRRAAHERVWFERLQEQFQHGAVPSQRLLLAVPLELDPIATALLLDRLAFLNARGFEIVEFGRNFFRIESVPTWMEPADVEPFLRDVLGAVREGRWQDKTPDLAADELARLAAAKAVRLPERAGEFELQALVSQLFATRNPLTSPVGRPTYIELNHSELGRRFNK
ncbi:MAG: DNA mismatch repair protein MutL, partial [Opitutaceae bacterium]